MDMYVQRMRNYLIEKARIGETVTYKDLSWGIGQHNIDFNNKYAGNSFTKRLEDVLRLEISKGRPCLTILVVEAMSSRPTDYFFELINKLNLNPNNLDNEAFFLKERDNVIECWKNYQFYLTYRNDVDLV